MKDITIKIRGRQYIDDALEDTMEFVTEGKSYIRNGIQYYIYEECDFSGFENCKTSLKVTDDSLKMKRIGNAAGLGADLHLKVGERFTTRYKTQMGDIDMEVRTNEIIKEIDEEGLGKITVDYRISLGGISDMRNVLEVEITE